MMEKLDIPMMLFAFIGLLSYFIYPFFVHQIFGIIYACYYYYRILESRDPICNEYKRLRKNGKL